jgi:AcrR family transcriptional regulator
MTSSRCVNAAPWSRDRSGLQAMTTTEQLLCYIGLAMSSTSEAGGTRRSRREERKEETRGELIAAAARVFARHGYHGASLEQIAGDAGYSTGAIYWHFSGKEDLFLAVYEAYAAARAREFDDIHTRAQGSTGQRARAYADQWMARLNRDPDFLVLSVEFLVHAWRNPPLREAFSHRVAAGRLALARILEHAAQGGAFELPMPAEDLATALREMGSGLGLAKLIDTDGVPDTLFGDFIEMLFNLLRERRHPSERTAAKPRRTKTT